MFGKLKDKLKNAFKGFTKKVDEESEVVETKEDIVAKPAIEEKKDISKPVEKPAAKKNPEPKEKPTAPKKSKPAVKKESQKPLDEVSEDLATVEKKIEEDEIEAEDLAKKVEAVVEEVEPIPTEVEEEVPEVIDEPTPAEEKPAKKGFFKGMFGKKDTVQAEEPKTTPSLEEEIEKEDAGFFSKIKTSITTKKISGDKFEDLFEDVSMAMLENNVSFEVVEKLKEDLKEQIVDKPIARNEILPVIIKTLRTSVEELFDVPTVDILKQDKKPYIISFIGVNGSGKTTQVAKVANMLKKNSKTCVIAACDTFRAAAIQQLETHANNLDIKIIKHDYGADAAAVAFDAIDHAKAKGLDYVLIDTAGRLHSNTNLMNELSKLMRVANPDLNIFVGESITGNDCVEQATLFGEAVRIDGSILTKADVDDKGGAPLSISYITKKPILFLGTGQGYDDLVPFDKKIILENLGL